MKHFKLFIMRQTIRLRIRRQACVVCGESASPWVWMYEDQEARLCDWHNAYHQMESRGHPVRRDPAL